ncbi:NmrA-like family domain-containing protein 1 [Agrobacterium albertimagni AOL15]|uniref:NmrA-like family domain-containing protein 1 n=1 Tax=Agrobacterium albertimagni AOL15 TaxID=1156935 RepID=K2PG66_9HYPH|nr:NmrA/HSCARG family protein [Agrobacterium albertimagni]EKF59878.1 NmrA-like family domain-containing protein 1 [Agrobacterium albertimagni AOL15]
MTQDAKPLVAIVGATSKQGRSVAETLLGSQRFRVRALTRSSDSPAARRLADMGAEIANVPLELGRTNDLVRAFEGALGVFLMTPPVAPPDTSEAPLGRQLADAAVAAGVQHIVFSTLENVDAISNGSKYAPHFTDKAKVADYIRGLPVSHSFVMLAFFYTNLLEYYVPRYDGDRLLLPIYLPENFRAPFVDPLTATGPVVLEIFSNPAIYAGRTLPIVGDIISPREMVETFQRVTGIRAEYRNAFTRDGLLENFPAFASNDLLVKELLGMVQYAVEYGYFSEASDLEWSRRLNPSTLNWEQFLRTTGWRGTQQSFGI